MLGFYTMWSLIVISERDKAWVFFEEFDPGSG